MNGYLSANQYSWLQYSEFKKWKETQISKDYHISWIPTSYLIDPEGKIAFSTLNAEEMLENLILWRLNYRKNEDVSKCNVWYVLIIFISLFMKILFSFPVIIMPFLLRMKHIDNLYSRNTSNCCSCQFL